MRRLAELYARGEAHRLAQAQRPGSVDPPIESESVPEPTTAFAPAPSPEDSAIAFLKARLGDGKPHAVVQIHTDADAAGVDLDALQRARNMLAIETRSGPGRPSTWRMEIDEGPAPPAASISPLKPLNPDWPPAPESNRGMDGPGAWVRERFDQSFNDRRDFPEPGESLESWMAAQRMRR